MVSTYKTGMKLYSTIIVIVIVAFLSSCEKDDTEKSWVSTASTQCANAWDNLGLKSTEDNVTEYLRLNDIRVYDFKIEVVSYGPFCAACNCPSGLSIQVLIADSDINTIKELGFEI